MEVVVSEYGQAGYPAIRLAEAEKDSLRQTLAILKELKYFADKHNSHELLHTLNVTAEFLHTLSRNRDIPMG